MAIYNEYAPFYDGSGQVRFALLTRQYLDEVLARHPAPGRRALDLACGTGTLALSLAEEGWQVVGIDQSEAMLAIARERAGATDLSATATFVQGDLRELDLSGGEETTHSRAFHPHPSSLIPHPSSFDLVTCTYDSLNYLLTEDDLARCFDGVAQALAWGGVFYADMNTGHFLAYDWPACEVLERNGFIQVAQSWFDPQTNSSTMRLTGFSGDDEHGYTRFDETHIERAYPPAIIAGLLTSAGLHVEAAYECFTFMPHHEQSQRIAWIARKPNQDKNSTA